MKDNEINNLTVSDMNLSTSELMTTYLLNLDGRMILQILGILMAMNCRTILADIFSLSHESEFLWTLVKHKMTKQAILFNFLFRSIDQPDVLPINNQNFFDWFPLVYLPEL